ncbi:MAG: RdgB/HAM1 family non-canonical purine NTP pyrophosphatase [Dehalococcoidia bacterium]|nr:MAG: RdgB/HAM1 family non-canonical purine NTP pyrophosphatase [Dehalococcoidia bacterium]
MLKLLLATGNKHKLNELKSLFQDIPYELISPSEIGIHIRIDENGSSFHENAKLKAIAFASSSYILSLADDSGLEVDALSGKPGVLSARYAGLGATDTERIDFLLSNLKDIPEVKRQAIFKCVIAIASPEGKVKFFSGECQGIIKFEPIGDGGFGYDPIFYLPHIGKTMAELTQHEKNTISHRGLAAAKARTYLLNLANTGLNGIKTS